MVIVVIIIIMLALYALSEREHANKMSEENTRMKRDIYKLEQLLKNNNIDIDGVSAEYNYSKYYNKQEAGHLEEIKANESEVKEKVEYVQVKPKVEEPVLTPEEIAYQNELMEKEKREMKNSAILLTGAFLIVLAAIVFLTSTWNTMPDIIKTMVLVLLVGVFLGGSKIAKEQFKLEHTSTTFFYIAMAYIPICLISISVFGLFGNYLSIYGEGRYIYLTFCGIAVSVLYNVIYKLKQTKPLFYGSIISQISSIILFTLIFENSIRLVAINLLLYNVVLILLKGDEDSVFAYLYKTIPFIAIFISIFFLFSINIYTTILLSLIIINFGILEYKKSNSVYSYVINIYILIFGFYIVESFNLEPEITQMLKLFYTVLMFIIEPILLSVTKREDLKKSCTIISLLGVALLYIESIMETELMHFTNMSESIFTKPFVFAIVEEIMLIVAYIKSKELGKKVTSYLIPVCFIISGLHIIDIIEMQNKYHLYVLFSLATFVITQFIRGEKLRELNRVSLVVSHMLIVFTYLTAFSNNLIIYFILLLAVHTYSYYIEKYSMFKYAAYIVVNLILMYADYFVLESTDFIYFIPMITTIVIINLERYFKNLKDDASIIFIAVSECIALFAINSLNTSIGTVFTLGFTGYLIYENIKEKRESMWNIIPLLGAMPAIFNSNIDSNLATLIQLLTVIGLTGVSVKNKKINLYTVFSCVYLIFTISHINITITDSSTKYINVVLFIFWAIAHLYFLEEEKQKDIFRFLTYCGLTSLYYMFIYDLNMTEFSLFKMLGIIVFAIMVIRTIIVKYSPNVDSWEYIIFTLIYFSAFFGYSGEEDGMLFMVLVAAIVIISYMKGYGALFMVSIVAIFVNGIILTREFWVNLFELGWISLLLIGLVLIFFAVRNELNENKQKQKLSSMMKALKEKVDSNK